MSWTLIAHAHSRHSYDSLSDPRALVERAVQLGAHALAITDHDSWRGSIEAREYAATRRLPLVVIAGSEVATDEGDVIGLFLESDPIEKRALALCDRVHAEGGLIVLPHPCKWRTPSPTLVARADLIEVFNARTPRAANDEARVLAEAADKPALAAPDAHRVAELELARVVFEGEPPADDAALKAALLTAPRRFVARGGSIWDEWRSQAIKCRKRPDPGLAWHLARGVARRLAKPAEYAAE
ncbi:MAG: PHP domain-containing protein [Candidatus Eisenbacteria bacterium]